MKKLVGWDEFEAFRERARAAGRRVGIGLACYVEGTGVGPYEGAHVRVETNGTVVVATGLTTQGQGHETAFAQVAAETLGVAVERVRWSPAHPQIKVHRSGLRQRAAVMSGNAIAMAAGKVARPADRRRALETPDDLRSPTACKGERGRSARSPGTVAVRPTAALRFDEQTS